MVELLQDKDIVITSNEIRNQILKELTNKKIMLNLKFYTLNEFMKEYYGTYGKEAIYFLVKHYGLSYDVALKYLDNIYIDYEPLKEIKDTLKANNLLIKNDLFRKHITRIVVIGEYLIDPFLKKELEQYNFKYIDVTYEKENKDLVAYEFSKQIDEVLFVASRIRENLKTKSLNDIYLVNVGRDYETDIKKIFRFYGIPINLHTSKKIYGTKSVVNFLKTLKETLNIEDALNKVKDGDVKNKLIDIINDYNFVKDIDNTYIDIITEEIKNASIKTDTYKTGVNVISINDMVDTSKIYYLMGCNLGSVPSITHDEEYIKDKDRKVLGLLTSLDRLILNKENIKKKMLYFPNLVISYKDKDYYSSFYPSPLLNDLNYKTIIDVKIEYKYSNVYNRLVLGEDLDKYINYNEESEELKKLLNTYLDTTYNSYDNKYNYIDFKDLEEYLKGKINLSYSSMNNYYLCAFRFYIENVLKLDPFTDTFAAFLGNLFHDCLSKMYEDGFDLKSNYEAYLSKKELNAKEKFFCEKLYTNLEFIIRTIRFQEGYSKYNKVLTEKHISVDKSSKLKINFLGFVDKIKYLEEDSGRWLVAIIDYKTGSVETTLDNINYGLHLQLPVYIYLTKNGLHKNIKITGFYLQKILNNSSVDCDDVLEDLRKKLKLDGFTIDDEDLINKFDSSYENSEVIKGMGVTSKGFSRYAKLVSSNNVEKISLLVDEKIDEVVESIDNVNFDINPKRINGELVGCQFCNFKDVCFRKEEDIVDLEYTKLEDILSD